MKKVLVFIYFIVFTHCISAQNEIKKIHRNAHEAKILELFSLMYYSSDSLLTIERFNQIFDPANELEITLLIRKYSYSEAVKLSNKMWAEPDKYPSLALERAKVKLNIYYGIHKDFDMDSIIVSYKMKKHSSVFYFVEYKGKKTIFVLNRFSCDQNKIVDILNAEGNSFIDSNFITKSPRY